MIVIVAAGLTGLLIAFVMTPILAKFLRTKRLAQAIRVSGGGVDYPAHNSKVGTPSMGGLAILAGVLGGYTIAHLVQWRMPTVSGMLAIYLMLALSFVGIADDYLKIFKQRSTGVRARTKLIGQAAAALSFAAASIQFPDEDGATPASRAISVVRDTDLVLPAALFMLWIWLLVTATTNGVNLTDGLDGLASGAAVLAFGAYVLIGVWQYGQSCATIETVTCYGTRNPLDLAAFAAAVTGSVLGFLWWNTKPAIIFMGDTGSLGLGGALAALAVLSRTEVLLVFIGGLFVIISLSVIAQVGSFKLTGRRVLKMAPLHHHFELLGWQEITIVVRFWLIQSFCVAIGLVLFYAEWVKA